MGWGGVGWGGVGKTKGGPLGGCSLRRVGSKQGPRFRVLGGKVGWGRGVGGDVFVDVHDQSVLWNRLSQVFSGWGVYPFRD